MIGTLRLRETARAMFTDQCREHGISPQQHTAGFHVISWGQSGEIISRDQLSAIVVRDPVSGIRCPGSEIRAPSARPLKIIRWKLETGNWKLETGNWQLATGNWQLATGNCKQKITRRTRDRSLPTISYSPCCQNNPDRDRTVNTFALTRLASYSSRDQPSRCE